MQPRAKWLALFALVVALFYSEILFSHQFSILFDWESVNLVYAPTHLAATMVKQWTLPVWNPYSEAGRSLATGPPAGVFYPPKALLYAAPFNHSGLLSPQLLQHYHVLTHMLAGWFMFLLAQEFGLACLPAFVAALCFSLGGFLGRVARPDPLDSAIWLPLAFVAALRALGSGRLRRSLLCAALCGLAVGTALLGGNSGIVVMQLLALAGACAFAAWQPRQPGPPPSSRSRWVRSAAIFLVMGGVALAAGAALLLPALEHSGLALRHAGTLAIPARQRIPYAALGPGLEPHMLPGLLLGYLRGPEGFSPYLGLLPFLLALAGVVRNWRLAWVKYLAGLGVAALLCALGQFSFLHGLLYAVVPYFWLASEPGRFLYLAQFAGALLAGFGLQSLLDEREGGRGWENWLRVLRWGMLAAALVLAVPAALGRPDVNQSVYLSFLFMAGSAGLFVCLARGYRSTAIQALVIVVIALDLSAFQGLIRNERGESLAHRNQLEALLASRDVADFLKSQPGVFRVHLEDPAVPHFGPLFGVETTGAASDNILEGYHRYLHEVPRGLDMLNAEFLVKRPQGGGEPVFQNASWAVYRNASACPRAWLVHEVEQAPGREEVYRRIAGPGFDPLRTAVVTEPAQFQPSTGATERVSVLARSARRLELEVQAESAGLLVVSEVDYPGWQATVNDAPARIVQVNGLLRGIRVPQGQSRVVFRYAPGSVLAGGLLSLMTYAAGLLLALLAARQFRRTARPAGASAAGSGGAP